MTCHTGRTGVTGAQVLTWLSPGSLRLTREYGQGQRKQL